MKPKEQIVIGVAVANFGQLRSEDLIEYIKKKAPELKFYKLNPPPGAVFAASIDWKLIGNISSVLGIVGFLWTAYIELIKPNKQQESNSGIIIRIENIETHNYIWIGNQVNSEKELLDSIRDLLEKNSISIEKTKELIDSLTSSKIYKEIK